VRQNGREREGVSGNETDWKRVKRNGKEMKKNETRVEKDFAYEKSMT